MGKMNNWTRWGRPPKAEPESIAEPVLRPESSKSLREVLAKYPNAIPHIQGRAFAEAVDLDTTMAAMGRRIRGSIPYNVSTEDVGGFRDVFARGCFHESIEKDDVRCLFSGNVDRVLGRKSAATLRLWDDPAGVHFSCDVPATSYGDDLLVLMRRGDVDQCSCQIVIAQYHFEASPAGERLRVIEQARLVALGPAAFSTLRDANVDAEQAIAAAREAGIREGMARAQRQLAARMGGKR
jgi:HK97 family phage prohead protease